MELSHLFRQKEFSMIAKFFFFLVACAFAIFVLLEQFYGKKLLTSTLALILSVYDFGAKWLVAAMILGTFLLVISLPPMLTSGAVLIAKNTPKKDQAFVLSLRTTAERTSQVLEL